MHVTVAICTWNRAQLLEQTLAGMVALRIPEDVTWELLIVNNNCTDETDTVIEKYRGLLPLQRLLETAQGQPSARNCAIAHAAGELLIWTDDDVLVESEWLAEYVAAARKWPEASIFGGPVDPWFEEAPPKWVLRNLEQLSGPFVIQRAHADGELIEKGVSPVGANMAFRTSVLKSSPFDPRFGRTGSRILGNDDIWKVAELQSAGCIGRWVPRARIRHFVSSSRMTPNYVFRFISGHRETEVLASGYENLKQCYPWWALRMWAEGSVMRLLGSPFRSHLWYQGLRRSACGHGVLAGRRGLLAMVSEAYKNS